MIVTGGIVFHIVSLSSERKGKEEYLYNAILPDIFTKHSNMDHTVLPANYTMSAFPS